MTYQRREEIFSKDAISLDEMTELLGVSKSTACREMQYFKRLAGDRLHLTGYIHVQDYLDALALSAESDRYKKNPAPLTA